MSSTSNTRQEFVTAAVSFLQNSKLVDTSLGEKLKFLKDKGLNEVEVDEALNLALVNRHQTQGSRWSFLLIFGFCLGGYKLYQAYIESKKSKELEEQKNKQKETIETVQAQQEKDVPTLSEILAKISELKRLLDYQRTQFASEIQSLKTLLLGHEKFAAPPVIPAWQLKENDKKESSDKKINNTSNTGKKNNKSTKHDSEKQSTSENFIDTKPIAPNLD